MLTAIFWAENNQTCFVLMHLEGHVAAGHYIVADDLYYEVTAVIHNSGYKPTMYDPMKGYADPKDCPVWVVTKGPLDPVFFGIQLPRQDIRDDIRQRKP